MQKAKEAIKYGLSVMGVTPKEMFALIESSNGYTGDDDNRWLTAQIIKIAEKDGVGYSQLLAKWFNIISSIEEESSDMTFKDRWVEKIRQMSGSGRVYTVGMGEENDFGTSLDEVDWFDGVDITWNTWFTDEKLPTEVANALHAGERITFVINADAKLPVKKGSSLVQNAKLNGIPCTSPGALLMYRMCNMLSAMDYPENLRVVLVADTAFLLSKENSGVIKYFLNYFSYDGFVINSKDLYNSAFTSEDFAIMSCETRFGDIQNGIVLAKVSGDDIGAETKRYSPGGNMWKKIYQNGNFPFDCQSPTVDSSFSITDGCVPTMSSALGYICKAANTRTGVLTSFPLDGAKYAPITKDNLSDVIAYYGVSEALHNAGLPCDIPEVLSGHPEYDMLVANCVPVFLFGINSNFRDYGTGADNSFDIEGSELVHKMLDRASQHFGYETKDLVGVCKGFLDYIQSNGESMVTKTFAEIRAEANNDDLNKAYIDALNRCLGYICTQYRRM